MIQSTFPSQLNLSYSPMEAVSEHSSRTPRLFGNLQDRLHKYCWTTSILLSLPIRDQYSGMLKSILVMSGYLSNVFAADILVGVSGFIARSSLTPRLTCKHVHSQFLGTTYRPQTCLFQYQLPEVCERYNLCIHTQRHAGELVLVV